MKRVLLEGGHVVTVDAADRFFVGDLLIDDGVIAAVGPSGSVHVPPGTRTVDARGCIVCPGFVQAHVHLCQVIFRGVAEQLPLLPWLSERIWPLEGGHSHATLGASARLGIAELLLGGTTSALDMGTVHHTAAIFDVAAAMGFRLTSGKAIMDADDQPAPLREDAASSLRESDALAERFHGAHEGRLRYAYAPRFILSCTQQLMRDVVVRARAHGCLVHTHSSENPGEVEAVRRIYGTENIFALHALGVSGPDVVLAHCVHLTADEERVLRETGTKIAHCPSTNLKLASGVARVPELMAQGIAIGIGADGAPCNNRLSAFTEMRLASLLQMPRHGAEAMPATTVLRMMTMGGARVLGIDDRVGSLEVGKRADVIVVGTGRPHLRPRVDPVTTLVYAAEAADVLHVFVDGRQVVRERRLVGIDLDGILDDADAALDEVCARSGVPRPGVG